MNTLDRCMPTLARLCLVLIFPFSAMDKIFNYSNALTQANSSPLPVPGWLLLLVGGSLELFGSLGILFNIYSRQFAILFIVYCASTAFLFHNFWIYPFYSADWQAHFWDFLKNFGLVGGFLFVACNAQMQSVDGAFTLKLRA